MPVVVGELSFPSRVTVTVPLENAVAITRNWLRPARGTVNWPFVVVSEDVVLVGVTGRGIACTTNQLLASMVP